MQTNAPTPTPTNVPILTQPASLSQPMATYPVAAEPLVEQWRRWALGPFNAFMRSASQAEEALTLATQLHERITAAGIDDFAIQQFAQRVGLADWDVGDTLMALAVYEHRTGLAPELVKGTLVRVRAQQASQQAAPQQDPAQHQQTGQQTTQQGGPAAMQPIKTSSS